MTRGIIILYFFSLYESICPGMVFCHQPDGSSEIEFALESTLCRCEHCPLCRERTLIELLEPWCPKVKLEASHCLHEDLLLENIFSDSLAANKKFEVVAMGPASRHIEDGLLAVSRRADGSDSEPSGLPPPRLESVLRC